MRWFILVNLFCAYSVNESFIVVDIINWTIIHQTKTVQAKTYKQICIETKSIFSYDNQKLHKQTTHAISKRDQHCDKKSMWSKQNKFRLSNWIFISSKENIIDWQFWIGDTPYTEMVNFQTSLIGFPMFYINNSFLSAKWTYAVWNIQHFLYEFLLNKTQFFDESSGETDISLTNF